MAKMPFKVHPHMLRHACGYALANKGTDTRTLAGVPWAIGRSNRRYGTQSLRPVGSRTFGADLSIDNMVRIAPDLGLREFTESSYKAEPESRLCNDNSGLGRSYRRFNDFWRD